MGVEARIVGTWAAIFCIIGAIFGAGYTLVVGYGAIIGTIAGGACGAFVGMLIAIRHRYGVSRLTNEVTEQALGSSHTRTLYVMLPYVSAFKLAEAILRSMFHTRLNHSDIEHGELGAVIRIPQYRSTHISDVWITVRALDATRSEVVVSCCARWIWRLLPDYGQSLDNMLRIARILESVSDGYTAWVQTSSLQS